MEIQITNMRRRSSEGDLLCMRSTRSRILTLDELKSIGRSQIGAACAKNRKKPMTTKSSFVARLDCSGSLSFPFSKCSGLCIPCLEGIF